MQKYFNKNPLFFTFLFPGTVDVVFTIFGQDKEYWIGEKVINEASPVYYILALSPFLYFLGSLIWFVLWYYIFLRISEKWQFFLMFLFIAGHSWGTGSWFVKFFKDQGVWKSENIISTNLCWGVIIGYFALVALFATQFIHRHITDQNS